MKVEQQIRATLRRMGLAYRTEVAYVAWFRRYVRFHNLRHPREMGKSEVEEYMNHLALVKEVAPGTQNQAFNALLFLYRHVLEKELEGLNAIRAKEKKKLPVVLSQDEVGSFLLSFQVHKHKCSSSFSMGAVCESVKGYV